MNRGDQATQNHMAEKLRPSLAVFCDPVNSGFVKTLWAGTKKAASLTRDRLTTARRYKSNKRKQSIAGVQRKKQEKC
jgi:hypothetical protein